MRLPHKVLATLMSVLVLTGLASCGGSSLTAAAPTGSTATDTTMADSSSELLSGLPSIPLDSGEQRAASEAGDPPTSVTVLGREYLQMRGGEELGDSLRLSTPAPEGDERPELAYALYQVSGLGEGRPQSLNVECLAGEMGKGYFIGVANYTLSRWSWFGPVHLPEFQLDLRGRDHRFVTQLGNLYFILVCPPDTSIVHSKTTVTLAAGGNGGGNPLPPGIAHGLRASKGGQDHSIKLQWQPGAGAAGYEVWRRPTIEGSPWQLLGVAPGTQYRDIPLPNFRYFTYRVRAVNPAGMAEFSNPDWGWAGIEAPRRIDGIIRGPNGQALQGVPVELSGYGPEMTRQTNAEGRFAFLDLAPGHYAVTPLPKTIDFMPPFRVANLTQQTQFFAEFNAGPPQQGGLIWGFVLTPGGPNAGAHLVPVAGATVVLTPQGNPEQKVFTTTNEHGHYVFPGLAFGGYSVKVEKEGMHFHPPQQPAMLGSQNSRERASFIGLPDEPAGPGE